MASSATQPDLFPALETSSSWSASNRHSLCANRTKMDVLVGGLEGSCRPFLPVVTRMTFTSADRTTPSWPWITRVMRPMGHSPRFTFGMTTSKCRQRLNFFAGAATCVVRFSLEHTLSATCSKSEWWEFEILTSAFWLDQQNLSTSSIWKPGLARPAREWLGVRGCGSCGSTLTCVNGLALSCAVTSDTAVSRTSSLSVRSLNTLRSARLADWVRRSQLPPKCWKVGGLKPHSTSWLVNDFLLSGD